MHSEAKEILERSDIEAVIISVPPHLHADIAVAAANAGKHLYLEKPVATTMIDAARIGDAVGRSGVTAVTGFNRRLHPLYEQARTISTPAGSAKCVPFRRHTPNRRHLTECLRGSDGDTPGAARSSISRRTTSISFDGF